MDTTTAHAGTSAWSRLAPGMYVRPMAISLPITRPTMPPSTVRVTASRRNWSRMAEDVAPTALRRPISRVRSLTETSMMFMMPMPPTRSEMPTMPPAMAVTPEARLLNWLMYWSMASARKVSGSSRPRPRWRRITYSISAFASSAVSGLVARHANCMKYQPSSRRSATLKGMKISAWLEFMPNILAWMVSTIPTTRKRRPPSSTWLPTPLPPSRLSFSSSTAAWLRSATWRALSTSSWLNGRPSITLRPTASCHAGQMPLALMPSMMAESLSTLMETSTMGEMPLIDGHCSLMASASLTFRRTFSHGNLARETLSGRFGKT